MKKYRLIIFAFIMSFCTSTTVSFVIVYFNSSDTNLIQNFIDTIINKKTKPIISLKEQFDTMSVCLSAEKSLKLKKKIKINYL